MCYEYKLMIMICVNSLWTLLNVHSSSELSYAHKINGSNGDNSNNNNNKISATTQKYCKCNNKKKKHPAEHSLGEFWINIRNDY